MIKPIEIKKPTKELVEIYLNKFNSSQDPKFRHYPYQEKAVIRLVKEFPENTNLVQVLLKVGILNSFYSTNIFKPFDVAENILRLKIDERLQRGDLSVVNEIAKNEISKKEKNFYSFATKYCSMHHPQKYPIYDSYIMWLLKKYQKKYGFSKFTEQDLRDYTKFIHVLEDFRNFFELKELNYKQLDQFLWTYAKEIKPESYNKKEV